MTAKERYWQYSLVTIIIVLGIILLIEFLPFSGGILGASTIYILLRGQMIRLTEKKHMKTTWMAILLLTETILGILIPLSLTAWLFIDKLQTINLNLGEWIKSAEHLAALVEEKTGYDLLNTSNLSSLAAVVPKIGQALMGSISSFTLNVFVLLFVLYFMLIGGKRMEDYIYDLLPFSDRNKKNVLREIHLIVKSNAIGIPLLALIQGFVAMIGYFIVDIPNAVLFGFLTCFATIIPIVGTAIVWFPLILYLLLIGSWGKAIILGIYALLIIINVDNFARFILQKKIADTHPLITIFGVIIGLSLFGFIGVIFGPLLLSLFLLCIDIFKREFLDGKARPVRRS